MSTKRLFALCASAALAIGGCSAGYLASAAAASPQKTAKPPAINVAADHVTCNSIAGSMGFKPALKSGGASPTAIKVSATLSGCTDTDNGSVQIASGTVTGTLNRPANECVPYGVSSISGSLIVKWKTLAAQPKITPTSSSLNLTQLNLTVLGPIGGWGGSYPEFQIGTAFGTAPPNESLGSAFTGSDSGNSSTLDSSTSQDGSSYATSCLLTTLKVLNFGVGSITLG